MILRDFVRSARARLAAAGIDASEAGRDAALLARHVLGWDAARLLAHETDPAPEDFGDRFAALLARRERREPMSSITGTREFWGLDFEVTRDVLTPRPETEIILEEALACLSGAAPGAGHAPLPPAWPGGPAASNPGAVSIVDVGTGSGCLAICLARLFPDARVVATDVSRAALEVAARNASRLGVADRIDFRQTSLLDGVESPITLAVSNPPYVPSGSIPGLMPEVAKWEPRQALDGGPDGLDVIRALVAAAPAVVAPGGWLVLEFGYGQEDGVRAVIRDSAFALVRIASDLQGIPRTLVARARV